MRKHVGWHDDQNNAGGILSTTLASDVQQLNAVSTEGLATAAESMSSLLGGIIFAFIFSWKVALIAIGIAPFMMVGAVIGAKVEMSSAGVEKGDLKKSSNKMTEAQNADLLANDAISNYRTVAGFNLNAGISKEYARLINFSNKAEFCQVQVAATAYGYSKFIENSCIGIILYFGTLIMLNDSSIDPEDIFLAMFAIIFAAFGAGQASSYGPDAQKAIAPAMNVFKVTDTPTKINAVEIDEGSIDVPKDFVGSIEFKNIWFRYPMRPKHWVFKGLNLKINPKDSIAVVGESGQGKSTLILLLMRFYDVDQGEILIDGVNIKDYNIA